MPWLPSRRSLLLAAASSTIPQAGIASPSRLYGDQESTDQFVALETATGGRLGVAAVNTANGEMVEHRADERFPFCSTFKLMAVSAVLKRSASEIGLLERRIICRKADMMRYSPVTESHVGKSMAVSELCAAALQHSDNTAANLLLRLLGGPGAVTAFARSMGDDMFRLDRREPALNTAIPGDPRDTTTPGAMMQDLRRLALGDLLAPASRDQLVAWMRGCKTGAKRIRAGAPAGWSVADKTGTGDYGTTNDVAVLWPPHKSPLVIAVYFTQHAKDAPPRDDVVTQAAQIVVKRMAQ